MLNKAKATSQLITKSRKNKCDNWIGEHTANCKGCWVYEGEIEMIKKPKITEVDQIQEQHTWATTGGNTTYARTAAGDTSTTHVLEELTRHDPKEADQTAFEKLVNPTAATQAAMQKILQEISERMGAPQEAHRSPRRKKYRGTYGWQKRVIFWKMLKITGS